MTTAMAATSTAIDRIDATPTDRFTTVAVGIAATATFVTVAALCRQARRGTDRDLHETHCGIDRAHARPRRQERAATPRRTADRQ